MEAFERLLRFLVYQLLKSRLSFTSEEYWRVWGDQILKHPKFWCGYKDFSARVEVLYQAVSDEQSRGNIVSPLLWRILIISGDCVCISFFVMLFQVSELHWWKIYRARTCFYTVTIVEIRSPFPLSFTVDDSYVSLYLVSFPIAWHY